MTITEFLEARIAEDEATARAATPGPWLWDGVNDEDCLMAGDAWVISASGMHTEGYLDISAANREHIARHDPARVLAECAAKRAIIADHAEFVHAIESLSAALPGSLNQEPDALWRSSAPRRLAAVYANHPDYRQDWAL